MRAGPIDNMMQLMRQHASQGAAQHSIVPGGNRAMHGAKFAPDAVKEAFRDSMFEIRKMWEEELQKKKKKQDQLKKVDS